VVKVSRRQFVSTMPAVFGGTSILSACSPASDPQGYEAVAASTWRASPLAGVEGAALTRELVHCATLAPSSHNTQCWRFVVEDKAIAIRPDPARRCPVVDPDAHHLFVTLGCAAENLVQAALAHGLVSEPSFDATHGLVRVTLAPATARASPLFLAIASRQCTRGDYDGQPRSRQDLNLLERADTSNGVRMLLVTDRPAMERVLKHVVQGNTAQLGDPAFVRELKSWIRFNVGYLRTPMPADASAAAQADAHACLLDALGIRRAAVMGGSAGPPSALQMALRHPDQVSALILVVPLTYKPPTQADSAASMPGWVKNTMMRLLGSDFLFWAAIHVAHNQVLKVVLATPPELLPGASP